MLDQLLLKSLTKKIFSLGYFDFGALVSRLADRWLCAVVTSRLERLSIDFVNISASRVFEVVKCGCRLCPSSVWRSALTMA